MRTQAIMPFAWTRPEQIDSLWEASGMGFEAIEFGPAALTDDALVALESSLDRIIDGRRFVTVHFPMNDVNYLINDEMRDRLLRVLAITVRRGANGFVLHSNTIIPLTDLPHFDRAAMRRQALALYERIGYEYGSPRTWIGIENMPLIGNQAMDTDPLFVYPDDFADLAFDNVGIVFDLCHWANTVAIGQHAIQAKRDAAMYPGLRRADYKDFAPLADRIVHLHVSAFSGIADPVSGSITSEGSTPACGDLSDAVYREMLKPFCGRNIHASLEVVETDYAHRRAFWETLDWLANDVPPCDTYHRVRLSRHVFGELEHIALHAAVAAPIISQGPFLQRFEEEFADAMGVEYAVAFSSGTAALHAAYAIAGVSPLKGIVTSPLSFIATANAALFLGATPRFADVDDNGLLDSARAAAVRASGEPIVAVDFAGIPVRDELFARSDGALFIRDAAHSLGARIDGVPVAARADLAVFSLHPVKSITTAEGGVVTTHNAELAAMLRRFRSHGIVRDLPERDGPWHYEMCSLGFNYRLTEPQCALGSSQLRRLPEFLERRSERTAWYNEALNGLPITTPRTPPSVESSHHLYIVRVDPAKRRSAFDGLMALGIEPQVHYLPIHLHRYYRERFGGARGQFPNAEAWYDSGISLPLHPLMSKSEVLRVRDALARVLA